MTPTTTGLQKTGISFDGAPSSGLPPGACGSFTFTQNQTSGITAIATAQENALSQMINTLSPVAVAIVNNQPPSQTTLINAANQYQEALASAATSVMSQGNERGGTLDLAIERHRRRVAHRGIVLLIFFQNQPGALETDERALDLFRNRRFRPS